MEKLRNYILSKPDLFTFLGLGVLFYLIFFHNIGTYPLMDADETRYVSMARDMFHSKDYLTLYLNGEYFFEKPPLFFWLETISFTAFGKVNEFTARFPVSLLGTAGCFLVYLMGKKIISRSYGVISSIILATSIEYLMLAKLAILDIVVSFFISISLCFGLAVYFCRESRKKYYWWLFYIFSAFAVMAKGIPGFVVPFGSMFFIALVSGKIKEIFKPIYFIPGGLLFLLTILPWHIIMLKMYNPLFWDEYIIKHHIHRFLGYKDIDRTQPIYFYFITLLWGFCPWIVSCLGVWLKKGKRLLEMFKMSTTLDRFLVYNTVIVVFTLFFFSISETKLITYILPLYPALACLGGYVWWNYIYKNQNENYINITNYIFGGLLIAASICAIFAPVFLPEQLVTDVGTLRIFTVLVAFSCGLATILFTKKRIYLGVFVSLVIFITLFSSMATKKFFQIDYKFGQDDLMRFAEFAKEKNASLTTFKFGTKYSLIYYGDVPVTYGTKAEISNLNEALNKENNYVIIRNKEIKKLRNKNFVIIDSGRKYSLIDKKGK